jgi:N-acyl-phosphatidylethanolamine-hydrolysing phospholipase D
MHWGAFALSDEPLGEPPVFLRDAAQTAGVSWEEFQILAVGETVVF